MISFKSWIDKKGVDLLAEKLGVNVITIKNWRNGHCFPRVEYMRAIRKMSRGQITYEHIIDGISK